MLLQSQVRTWLHAGVVPTQRWPGPESAGAVGQGRDETDRKALTAMQAAAARRPGAAPPRRAVRLLRRSPVRVQRAHQTEHNATSAAPTSSSAPPESAQLSASLNLVAQHDRPPPDSLNSFLLKCKLAW
jgi:hypothetical protein